MLPAFAFAWPRTKDRLVDASLIEQFLGLNRVFCIDVADCTFGVRGQATALHNTET